MRDGFSAWEEVIVLAVIAIMVSVVYQRYRVLRNEAIRTQLNVELSNLKLAVELYRVKNGKLPSNLLELYKKGYLYYRDFRIDKKRQELLDRLNHAYIYDNKTGSVYINPKTIKALE
ncbi:hypothetical protein [Hippea sp. KM1]|uniref:hypothetical protein n=1 Tax=Hippea sp. KM1 TaxID=944481 RepID=UPI00046D063E|nr:hypothetical protein [Hippea sp. KM1]